MDHPNVHSVLRVSVEDDYVPVVVYPIMEYGNLHQFLSLCRLAPMDSPLNVGGGGRSYFLYYEHAHIDTDRDSSADFVFVYYMAVGGHM